MADWTERENISKNTNTITEGQNKKINHSIFEYEQIFDLNINQDVKQ